MTKNLIKVIGLVSTLVGIGATLVADWVEEKKVEAMIEEKIDERLPKEEDEE